MCTCMFVHDTCISNDVYMYGVIQSSAALCDRHHSSRRPHPQAEDEDDCVPQKVLPAL